MPAFENWWLWRQTDRVMKILCPGCFGDLDIKERSARITPMGPEPPLARLAATNANA